MAQRSKEAERMSHAGIWQKSFQGREKNAQWLEMGVCLACLKDNKKAIWQKWGK